MYNVGACYQLGSGVAKDLNKAKEWYTKAAAQGQPNAQPRLDLLNTQRLLNAHYLLNAA